MKKLLLSVALLGVVLGVAAQNSLQGAEMTFDITEHNFGVIKESDGKASFDYTFTNTGTTPLVITRIIISCKCVDTNFSKRPLAPGEKGVITVTYNPRKQEGVFYKVIQIYTNTAEERHVITAKGEVVP